MNYFLMSMISQSIKLFPSSLSFFSLFFCYLFLIWNENDMNVVFREIKTETDGEKIFMCIHDR